MKISGDFVSHFYFFHSVVFARLFNFTRKFFSAMKKVSIPLLTLSLSFLFFACNKPNNKPDKDDDSPGVDEYVNLVIDGQEFKIENDDYIYALGQHVNTNGKITIAVKVPDSLEFIMSFNHAGTNNFNYDFSEGLTTCQLSYNNSIYSDISGTGNVSISTHKVNQYMTLNVFTGTANILLKEFFNPDAIDTISASISFKAAGLL